MAKPRLLLAGDEAPVPEAFRKRLASDFDIAGPIADEAALMQLAPVLKPDIVVLDLSTTRLNGMQAGKELKRILPLTRIIVLTMIEDFDLATEALRNWASGYLLKKSAASELPKAIREVLKGRTYVAPKAAQRLLEELIRVPASEQEKRLTKRQKEVLQLLAEGRTMREVADRLDITTRTVAFHKYQIMEEHGLRTQSDIIMFAIRQRVVALPH